MKQFYTNAIISGNSILVRGYENNAPFQRKEEFFPTLYINSNKTETKWKTIFDEPVEEIKPGSISDTRDFVKRYEDVEGFSVYGNTNYARQYVSDNYRGDVDFNVENIRIYSIDIETETELEGFPYPDTAREKVQLITIMDAVTKRITTFGITAWNTTRTDVNYIRCSDEVQLLKEFIVFWSYNYPDIVTGWNTKMFDIPYLVNRIRLILGEDYVKKLSPWGKVREKNIFINGKEHPAYVINGVASLDYLDLYKKFTYVTRESYKLDHIAFVELGENKLENPGETFREFYQNYPDTFIDYNIQDTVLIDKLEDKLKLIELAISVAYKAKVNFDDVFSPIMMWDSIIYNHLRDECVVIPPEKFTKSTEHLEGAYVKEPAPGYYKSVASFDLASLYPSLIMHYNISPENIINPRDLERLELLVKNELKIRNIV